MVPYIYTKFIYVLSHFCDGDLYISETEKKHDIFLVAAAVIFFTALAIIIAFFCKCCCFKKREEPVAAV